MRCSRSSSGGKPTSRSRSSAPFSIARFSDKPLIAQYFRTIADVDGLVNLVPVRVVELVEAGLKKIQTAYLNTGGTVSIMRAPLQVFRHAYWAKIHAEEPNG